MQVSFSLNGEVVTVDVPTQRTLAEVLRENLGLTGTKIGCNRGECGACTVLLDGRAVNSCLILAPKVHGKKVVTIEGLSSGGPDTLQEAFAELGAVQCGYCTPGMIMAAKALLLANPNPTEEQIREAISGNLCRCTGYTKIVAAIRRAAEATVAAS